MAVLPSTLHAGIGLGLALFGLLVLIIVFGVTVSVLRSPSRGGGGGGGQCDNCSSNVCLTESCTRAAALILSNLNSSVKPCDDFYNFTCGGWAQKTVIPTGTVSRTCTYMHYSGELALSM